MKIKFLTILFLLVSFSLIKAQVVDSKLANGVWRKFAVTKSGVYKIDKATLEQIGISTKGLDPRTLKIIGTPSGILPESNNEFRYSSLPENAIVVKGQEDGVFNDDDYILFYTQGVDGWDVDVVNATAKHVKNIYSDYHYYFISSGGSYGKRIQTKIKNNETPNMVISSYDDYMVYEKDNINLFKTGQKWLGEPFDVNNRQSFNLKFSNIYPNSKLKITTSCVASSSKSSLMKVSLGNKQLYNISFPLVPSNSLTKAYQKERVTDVVWDKEDIILNLTYNNYGAPSANAYLDYIEIVGQKKLQVDDKQFVFRNFKVANIQGVVRYKLANASNVFQVWDVTNPVSPIQIQNYLSKTNFEFIDNAGMLREYVVSTANDFYKPVVLDNSVVNNQNLHSVRNVEYLIITNQKLYEQAQRLASYHQKNSGFSTKTVLVNEIFNEFASGARNIVGIRDFIKNVYQNSSEAKKLKFVCFFGDTSYDFKHSNVDDENIVPSYQSQSSYNLTLSYVTDDFYGYLDESEGLMPASTNDSQGFQDLDVVIGRIPAATVFEAQDVVDKILSSYETESLGDWHNTITLVADDIDQNADKSLQSGLDKIADEITVKKPGFNIQKIYSDAYKQQTYSGGERYPEVEKAIRNAIEKGTLLFNYFGHGGEEGLSNERIIDKQKIKAFTNKNKLPLFITVTCDFSRFDNPENKAAGEMLFIRKNGGASSMITTSREIFISTGEVFNKRLMSFILQYDNRDNTIAEALTKAKNGFGSNQKLFVFYFGDPAMKLAIPKPNVRITKINGKDITQSLDTLKALSKVTLEGEVTNMQNERLTNFNGELITSVFDKPLTKKTLDNNHFGVVNTFTSQESKLYKGKSSIKNGVFKFDFVVPKDIKITYGKGKISFYASNKQLQERGGANFDVVVGGIASDYTKDSEGPQIELFMNTTSFVDGGTTGKSPNLIIKLTDENGINTSVTSVDHDIVAVIDDDELNPIILNDYYQTDLDSYQQGKVEYKLTDLNKGIHTIKIKAWDTHNNSSQASLTFKVIDDKKLSLSNVLNYPNPFVDYTEFWFNHNKPNELLEVSVQIYTVTGKLIKTITQSVNASEGFSRSIHWNGLDDFGNPVAKGVYVYKLRVKSVSTGSYAEKYEKIFKL